MWEHSLRSLSGSMSSTGSAGDHGSRVIASDMLGLHDVSPGKEIVLVKILKIWTLKIFLVITLKFGQGGFTILSRVQKMHTEWQTV